MSKLTDKIVEIAKSYVGQKEIPPNKGFEDKDFEQKMRKAGWWASAAWCVIFTKLVWKEAYKAVYSDSMDDQMLTVILSTISSNIKPNSQDTIKQVEKFKDFVLSKEPVVGSIVIWRKTATSGHAAIVVKVINSKTIETVEGNTNEEGSREGDQVALKKRSTVSKKGWEIMGYIVPKEY